MVSNSMGSNDECNLAVTAARRVMEDHCGEPVEYRCDECKALFFQPIDEHGTYFRIAGNNYFMRCGGKVEKVKP